MALCSLGINFGGPKQEVRKEELRQEGAFPSLFLSVEKSALIFPKRVKNIQGFALNIYTPFFLKRQVDIVDFKLRMPRPCTAHGR